MKECKKNVAQTVINRVEQTDLENLLKRLTNFQIPLHLEQNGYTGKSLLTEMRN